MDRASGTTVVPRAPRSGGGRGTPNYQRSPVIRLSAEGDAALAAITSAVEPWEPHAASDLTLEELMTARRVVAGITEAARDWAPRP